MTEIVLWHLCLILFLSFYIDISKDLVEFLENEKALFALALNVDYLSYAS